MRVWLINHYAAHPRLSTSGSRHHSLALGLKEHGWDVTIFAADTAHPSGARFATPGSRESLDGVRYRWIWTTPYVRGGEFTRLLNMLWFTASMLRFGVVRRASRPDIVVGSSVHPFAAWAGSLLARLFRVPFIFEIRDLWPETLVQIGGLSRRHPFIRVLAVIERHLVARATTIVTTMPNAYEYLEGIGVPASKVVWISNGVDLRRFKPTEPPDPSIHEMMYFGSLGPANGMRLVLDGFASAVREAPSIRLTIVGDGPQRGDLEDRAAALGVDHAVHFVGAVERSEIPRLAAGASSFIACTLPLALYNYGISLNKLFEYLAAGRPIVFGGSRRGNPIADARGVFLVEPTADGLSAGMRQVAALDQETARSLGESNRDYVTEHFSFDSLSDRLAGVLENAVVHHEGIS